MNSVNSIPLERGGRMNSSEFDTSGRRCKNE